MATSGGRTQRATLASLMLIVAAVAVGIGWTKAYFHWSAHYGMNWGATASLLHRLRFYIPAAFPGVMMATLALMLMHLIPPRLTAREMLRRPGTVSCLVVSLFFVFQVGCLAIRLVAERLSLLTGDKIPLHYASVLIVWRLLEGGLAVAGAWLVLWASQTRDGGSSWMEWVGKLIGALWVAAYVVLNGAGYFL